MFLLAIIRTPVLACDCGYVPPCGKVGSTAVVFVGVPLSEGVNSPDRDFPDTLSTVRFKIKRSFKGLPDGTRFVDVQTSPFSHCGARFSVGSSYLVYSNAIPAVETVSESLTRVFRRVFYGEHLYPGRVKTHLCAGSKPIQQAAADVEFLQAWAARKTKTVIRGHVFYLAELGKEKLYDKQRGFSGAKVTALGPGGHHYTTIVDDEHKFTFTDLPGGKYKITVGRLGSHPAQPTSEVDVAEGGCVSSPTLWMHLD